MIVKSSIGTDLPSAANEPAGGEFRDIAFARVALKEGSRSAVLSAAAAILSNEGPGALSVRKVAEAVNASTKVIYTTFGGKDGLLDALYLHSFKGFGLALSAHSTIEDPPQRLLATCQAYRTYALTQPALYNFMFGDLGRSYQAPTSHRRQAWETFHVLRVAVEACLPSSQSQESKAVTQMIWSTLHGAVSLEMRGLLGPSDEALLFQRSMHAMFKAHNIVFPDVTN